MVHPSRSGQRTRTYYDRGRETKVMMTVSMTVEEAEVAVEALDHVAREIFGDMPKGDRLRDASTAVIYALLAQGRPARK